MSSEQLRPADPASPITREKITDGQGTHVSEAAEPPENFEFGIDTFGDVMTDRCGQRLSDAETIRRTIDQAVLADSVGIDVFSVGEHYRSEQLDSAPSVILAAVAARTERIRLGTSVTVLSTQDPVRLFHQFATLDAVSQGRAELVVGRGSSTESFPLFGFDLDRYEQLFEENLDLWTRLVRDQPVTWSGSTRAPLVDETLWPAIEPGHLRTWIGIGGSMGSVRRAAHHRLPMMIAIIGGDPRRFAGHVELFHRLLDEAGHERLPVGQHSLGLIADTDDEAVERWWPAWSSTMERLAAERGFRRPDRASYLREVMDGALFVGSPETVARKIVRSARDLGLSRFDLKHDVPGLPWEDRQRTIELYGREVVPRVRELLHHDTGALDPPVNRPPERVRLREGGGQEARAAGPADRQGDWVETTSESWRPEDGASRVSRVAGPFGTSARNLLDQSFDRGLDGALAALETFYHALNNAHLELLVAGWAEDPLVQMNNPLGGIVRGRAGVKDVYDRLFRSGAGLSVTLSEITMFAGVDHVVFAGRERGAFTDPSTGAVAAIEIRTSRYFRRQSAAAQWQQFHHHGSVDDPVALDAYRAAVAPVAPPSSAGERRRPSASDS